MQYHLIISFTALSLLSGLALPPEAISASFRVAPIHLVFDQQVKSGLVDVFNEEEEILQAQIRAYEWTQDSDGKDQYQETKDIIFFPRILHINSKEKKNFRAGIKMSVPTQEKTYRIFIEELPDPRGGGQGPKVQLSLRFGVPVFVKPIKEEFKGEIEKIGYADGKVTVDIRNTGNSHLMIQSIKISGFGAEGLETFSSELSGWYLLAGAVRQHEMSMSQEVCKDTSKLDVEVKTKQQLTLHGQLDVIKTLCLP
jgi:fimbrial chaperone protein